MGFKGRSLFKFIIRGHFLLERNTPNSADVTPYLQKRTNNGDGSGPTMDQPTMGTVLVDKGPTKGPNNGDGSGPNNGDGSC